MSACAVSTYLASLALHLAASAPRSATRLSWSCELHESASTMASATAAADPVPSSSGTKYSELNRWLTCSASARMAAPCLPIGLPPTSSDMRTGWVLRVSASSARPATPIAWSTRDSLTTPIPLSLASARASSKAPSSPILGPWSPWSSTSSAQPRRSYLPSFLISSHPHTRCTPCATENCTSESTLSLVTLIAAFSQSAAVNTRSHRVHTVHAYCHVTYTGPATDSGLH